jgi:hypothetical protein
VEVPTVGTNELPGVQWWHRQREIRMLRSWYVQVGPEDMSRRRCRFVSVALVAGPIAAAVGAPVMVAAAIGMHTAPAVLIACSVAAVLVVLAALWRSAASLTVCVALLGSAAAVLGTRSTTRAALQWSGVAVLILLAAVTLSACLVRACREPEAVSWVEDEPAGHYVPGGDGEA